MSILVVGSVAIDSVRTPCGERKEALGGSATYFSMSASFFDKVDIVATVGTDFPKRYIARFRKKGIGIDGLKVARGSTFRWKGWYGRDLSTAHTAYTHLNVFKDFSPEVPPHLKNPRYVFLANIDPDLQIKVLKQVSRPELIACDSMNYWIATKRDSLVRLLKRVDIFLLNEAEARQLTGEDNLLSASRAVLSLGPKAVIIKKGENGVAYFSRSEHFAAPAYLLDTVRDPTGAGDTFAGGFMGYLGKSRRVGGAAIRRAIVCGTVMASFAVEDFSVGRLLAISANDIERRIKRFRDMTSF